MDNLTPAPYLSSLSQAARVASALLAATADPSNTRHGDICPDERNALEVLIAHAEERL